MAAPHAHGSLPRAVPAAGWRRKGCLGTSSGTRAPPLVSNRVGVQIPHPSRLLLPHTGLSHHGPGLPSGTQFQLSTEVRGLPAGGLLATSLPVSPLPPALFPGAACQMNALLVSRPLTQDLPLGTSRVPLQGPAVAPHRRAIKSPKQARHCPPVLRSHHFPAGVLPGMHRSGPLRLPLSRCYRWGQISN